MRVSLRVIVLLLGLTSAAWSADAQGALEGRRGHAPRMSPSLDAQVLAELNAARTDPGGYAERLRDYRAFYHGRLVREPGDEVGVLTYEGVTAIDEAIAYVERQRPLAPLAPNTGLARSAAHYAAEAGPAGLTGHVGRDGSTMSQRIRAAGVWAGAEAEDISFGPDTAIAVVRQLIIDDGVPGRGHRTTIFDPGYQVAGVGCGPHRLYGSMCVIDFAGGVVQR